MLSFHDLDESGVTQALTNTFAYNNVRGHDKLWSIWSELHSVGLNHVLEKLQKRPNRLGAMKMQTDNVA